MPAMVKSLGIKSSLRVRIGFLTFLRASEALRNQDILTEEEYPRAKEAAVLLKRVKKRIISYLKEK